MAKEIAEMYIDSGDLKGILRRRDGVKFIFIFKFGLGAVVCARINLYHFAVNSIFKLVHPVQVFTFRAVRQMLDAVHVNITS